MYYKSLSCAIIYLRIIRKLPLRHYLPMYNKKIIAAPLFTYVLQENYHCAIIYTCVTRKSSLCHYLTTFYKSSHIAIMYPRIRDPGK